MGIIARKFNPDDIESAIDIWNEIVEDGIAFPQMEQLDKQAGLDFFLSQSHTGVAIEEDTGKMVGKRAEMIGGFVLIVVGTSILCEHIGSSPGL